MAASKRKAQQSEGVFIGLICVLVVIAAVIMFIPFAWHGSSSSSQQQSQASIGTPVYAPAGQLVSGFPESLILDSPGQVSQSYQINYSSNTNQYTAVWDSSSSIVKIYNDYSSYLAEHAWQIVNTMATNSGAGLYATSNGSNLNMTVEPQGDASVVTLSYVPNSNGPAPQPNLTASSGGENSLVPPQFVIASDASILGSTDNPDPSSGTETVGVLYSTKESLDTLFAAYNQLLSAGGWQVLSQDKTSAMPEISAVDTSTKTAADVKVQSNTNALIVSVTLTMPLKNK